VCFQRDTTATHEWRSLPPPGDAIALVLDVADTTKPDRAQPRAQRGVALWIVLGVVLAVAGGGLAWWWHAGEGAERSAGTRAQSTLHLETFVLNLADPEQKAYLRIGMDLGIGKKAERGNDGVPVARLRDTILGVLATQKPSDLLNPEGKVKLKAELLRVLRERAPELDVEDVYFTEFLIQR
jgi:flagellar basal body-associated protein FliL